MLAIWSAAKEEIEKGRNFVLATITDVKGSSPRHVGTRFLVRTDGGIVGTIGGGLFEAQVQEFAKDALGKRESRGLEFSFTGEDTQSVDMICGGSTRVLLEFVDSSNPLNREIYERLLNMAADRDSGLLLTYAQMQPGDSGSITHLVVDSQGTRTGGFDGDDSALREVPHPRLRKPAQLTDVAGLTYPVFVEWIHPSGAAFIFGAGHVGACVAHLAGYAGFRVVVIDDRSDLANRDGLPDADEIVVTDSFVDCVRDLPIDRDAYIVIVTRGHAHDRTVLAQALDTDAHYIGMIGSKRKNKIIFDALVAEGVAGDQIARVHAPIGLPIGGETPQEIGFSIVAEMIQTRNKRD